MGKKIKSIRRNEKKKQKPPNGRDAHPYEGGLGAGSAQGALTQPESKIWGCLRGEEASQDAVPGGRAAGSWHPRGLGVLVPGV